MIIIKDEVSRNTLSALLEYSISDECQFLIAVKPKTQVLNDHLVQLGSVIKILKCQEKVVRFCDDMGNKSYQELFSIKVLVEDAYWVPSKGEKKDIHYKSGKVPTTIHARVNEILTAQ